MKYKAIALPALLAATALAGCKSNDPEPPMAPYANVYKATYASAAKETIDKALAKPGDKIQGGVAPVDQNYTANPTVNALGKPQAVEIEKTADGYIMRAGGEEVVFTDADYAGGVYEQRKLNSDSKLRTLGALYAMNDDTKTALSSSSGSMVPLGFYMRVEEGAGAATADSKRGLQGYMVVGLETDPSAMPKTGKASYSGFGRIDAHAKSINYDTPGAIEHVDYRGDAELEADFGKETVSGTVQIKDRRIRMIDGDTGWVDVSGNNAELALKPAKIVQNGFASELDKNGAAGTMMQADGISADTEAEAIGRFYGNDAGQVGAIVAGEGTSHVITGVIYGDRNP